MKKLMLVFLIPLVILAFRLLPPAAADPLKLESYKTILWNYLETLCAFGPRNPGSLGYQETIRLIKRVGTRYADEVIERRFSIQRSNGERLNMTNIEMRFEGTEGGQPILVGAHYDTRPFADGESDPSLREIPILGANDGGSGTAVLLGLARYLNQTQLKRPVHLVFFDGEDFGANGAGESFIGSNYYARQLEKTDPADWPYCVLIIDMVGDKNLEIYKETHSLKSGPWFLNKIYEVAKRQNFSQFRPQSRYTIFDDHNPFIRLNIPSVLLIDFDYPHWHKLADTLDKCSPESLFAVFSVVSQTLAEM